MSNGARSRSHSSASSSSSSSSSSTSQRRQGRPAEPNACAAAEERQVTAAKAAHDSVASTGSSAAQGGEHAAFAQRGPPAPASGGQAAAAVVPPPDPFPPPPDPDPPQDRAHRERSSATRTHAGNSRTAGSATRGSAPEGITFGDGKEPFSGLKLCGRFLRPERWEQLMQGKRYIPFDRLASFGSGQEPPDNFVTIGVVYEKAMPRTSSRGDRYVHWSVTDLAFPQTRVATILLFGEAFETWDSQREAPVATGTTFAILNPTIMPAREGGKPGEEARSAFKITHATQLLQLGACPSLGFCACSKKDGLKCSMPCDRDRGPLVCYYHTMSQAANKVRHWNQMRSGKLEGPGPGKPASSNGIFVIEGPRSANTATTPTPTRAGGIAWPGSGRPASAKAATRPTPVKQPAVSAPHRGVHHGPDRDGEFNAAANRLLKTASGPAASERGKCGANTASSRSVFTPRAQAQDQSQAGPALSSRGPCAGDAKCAGSSSIPTLQAGSKGIGLGQAQRPGQASADKNATTREVPCTGPSLTEQMSSALSGSRAPPDAERPRAPPSKTNRGVEGAQSSKAMAMILKQFPNGIPAPDPNSTLATGQDSGTPQGTSSSCSSRGGASKAASGDALRACAAQLATPQAPGGRAWAQPRPVTPAAEEGQAEKPVTVLSATGKSVAAVRQEVRTKERSKRQLEAEFGKRVALQLAAIDPLKDPIRQKQSRMASVVEQERNAKRMRRLAELEAMEAMEERMEAVKQITIQAWKCQQCVKVFDSDRTRAQCTQAGHIVVRVEAKKTRWTCNGCKFDAFVLNRQLPDRCPRCGTVQWQQVTLQRRKSAPMPRDGFLPRGEELPFLNSLPTGSTRRAWEQTREKEPEDDYARLDNPFND